MRGPRCADGTANVAAAGFVAAAANADICASSALLLIFSSTLVLLHQQGREVQGSVVLTYSPS